MTEASKDAAPDRGPLLDTDQASERCRLARQTMAIQRLRGTGCPYIKLGSRIYYYQAELDAWIAKHRRESTANVSDDMRATASQRISRPMTASEQVASEYVRVSRAAFALGVDSGAVYRLLQRGELTGLSIDGRQFVSVASVEQRKAAQATGHGV